MDAIKQHKNISLILFIVGGFILGRFLDWFVMDWVIVKTVESIAALPLSSIPKPSFQVGKFTVDFGWNVRSNIMSILFVIVAIFTHQKFYKQVGKQNE